MKFLYSITISLLFVILLEAKSSNSYGDEQVVPEVGGASDLQANTAPEQDSGSVSQTAGSSAKSVASGYRRRRRNAYGDELVVPAGGGAQTYVDNAVEQSPEAVQQSPMSHADVSHSGYRRKRNNQYGDEQVTPVGGGAQPIQNNMAEQPADAVQQNTASVQSSVQASGY